MFKSAKETLFKFSADHKYLGATPGAVMILHTWGQNMWYHPHIHYLVPAGGITKNGKWKHLKGKGKFLFPVKAMSKVYRGIFSDELIKLQENSTVKITPFIDKDKKYKHPIYKQNWVVYAKKQLPNSNNVIEYISRYSNRIAISEKRIKKITSKEVSFSWFNYTKSKPVITNLKGEDFLQRFILHILPPKFMKIRHYGFFASRNKTEIFKNIREQINQDPLIETQNLNLKELFLLTNGFSYNQCPNCKKGVMNSISITNSCRGDPNIDFNIENDKNY